MSTTTRTMTTTRKGVLSAFLGVCALLSFYPAYLYLSLPNLGWSVLGIIFCIGILLLTCIPSLIAARGSAFRNTAWAYVASFFLLICPVIGEFDSGSSQTAAGLMALICGFGFSAVVASLWRQHPAATASSETLPSMQTPPSTEVPLRKEAPASPSRDFQMSPHLHLWAKGITIAGIAFHVVRLVLLPTEVGEVLHVSTLLAHIAAPTCMVVGLYLAWKCPWVGGWFLTITLFYLFLLVEGYQAPYYALLSLGGPLFLIHSRYQHTLPTTA